MSRYKSDDVELLLPSFRVAVKLLLAKMTALGFEPVPFDTVRTAAEAAANAKKGTGTANSIHQWGCACDVICGAHGWSCRDADCEFYEALGREAEALKLVWGGRWKRVDMPHVQGIPVSAQPKMRALSTGADSAKERDHLVWAFLQRPVEP